MSTKTLLSGQNRPGIQQPVVQRSPSCQNCYAEVMARRLKAIGVKGYEKEFDLTLQPNRLKEPFDEGDWAK